MDTAREGKGETNEESSIDIFTVSCVKQMAGGKLPARKGSSAQGSTVT